MARFALAAIFVAAFAATSSAMTFTEYGIDRACSAYDAVCWYENLKQFPKTNSRGFYQCGTTCSQMKKAVMKYDEDEQKKYFGQFMSSNAWKSSAIPSQYRSNCDSALKSGSADTSDDESDALNGGVKELVKV